MLLVLRSMAPLAADASFEARSRFALRSFERPHTRCKPEERASGMRFGFQVYHGCYVWAAFIEQRAESAG